MILFLYSCYIVSRVDFWNVFFCNFYRNIDCICKINEWFGEYWLVDDVCMIKIKENLLINKNLVEILRYCIFVVFCKYLNMNILYCIFKCLCII